ncbi:MAG: 4-diphosphocytidyl-2-C-methyl-D-erythritol kinase [Thermodesulfobacteriota bacterium]|nr:4-diphosphocytidyl-2-C-methyl-D-erythritol kinase [Thermodesulfobacteriota bacterium]
MPLLESNAGSVCGIVAMKTVIVLAPAKINLFLRVLGLRPDGYHEIETLFQAVDLFDEIALRETIGTTSIRVPGHSDLETEANIVMRAISWLEKRTGGKLSVAISLNKKIPVAAGLGGGSSDAAAALLGMRDLFDLDLTEDDLWVAARSLGADVAFFLKGGTCVGEGIGEKLTPVDLGHDYLAVLANPGCPVSTAEVFRRYSQGLTGHFREGRLSVLLSARPDLEDLLHNDLQAVCEAMRPEIVDIRRIMEAHGATKALMSGSGPTVFGILRESEDPGVVDRVVDSLSRQSIRHFVVNPIAGGACIV